MDKTIDPAQSLSLISETLKRTKDNFAENSFGFKLWGWLIAIASFASYILLSQTTIDFPYFPFPTLAFIGVVVTIWHYRKKRKTESTETYLNFYLNRMWAVLGFSFFLTVFVCVQNNLQPFSYTLILAGIGTMVSGLIMKFRPLQLGGIFFFIAVLVSVFVSDEIRPLLHGIAIVGGYLLPAYLLDNKKEID